MATATVATSHGADIELLSIDWPLQSSQFVLIDILVATIAFILSREFKVKSVIGEMYIFR